MANYLASKVWLTMLASLAVALIVACGGDDDSSSSSAGTGSNDGASSEQGSGAIEMVPLSSLDLDLPFDLSYDPPVPSDATVSNAIEREGSETTLAGYDLTLDTDATYEDMKAAYDDYVATFDFGQGFPESQGWSGRRAEGEPGITITVIGERLNIAEILDN